jgi:hypothetical protein
MTDINGTLVLVPPPSGYSVNFENPQRQLQTQVYTVFVVENLFAFIFLIQRLYTKIFLMKLFQIEDGDLQSNLGFRRVANGISNRCRRLDLLDCNSRDPAFWVDIRRHWRTCLGDLFGTLWLILSDYSGCSAPLRTMHCVCQSRPLSFLWSPESEPRFPVRYLVYYVRHSRVLHRHIFQYPLRMQPDCCQLGPEFASRCCMHKSRSDLHCHSSHWCSD